MFLFHVASVAFPDLFQAYVRLFQAYDEVTRAFNAHRPWRLRRATDLALNDGPLTFFLQTRRGGL